MSPIPVSFAKKDWYSTPFIAYRLKRPLRTIQYWCKSGFLEKRGCQVIQINYKGWYRGYWVHIPREDMSHDAILNKVPLDIPPSIPPRFIL